MTLRSLVLLIAILIKNATSANQMVKADILGIEICVRLFKMFKGQ